MTNTETVSTARKVWPLGGYAPGHYQNNCVGCGKDFIGDKRSVECLECAVANANRIIDEALSARTQSPAEWQVEALRKAYIEVTGATMWPTDEQFARILRAASIPAPERSKEETGVRVKPLEWVDGERGFPTDANTIIGRYRVWDFDGEDSHYMRPEDRAGLYVGGNLDHAKAAAQADYEQRIKSTLETPPLHKEGEAVAALRDAIAWIVEAPHDEHCFTNDPNPDACRCVCGKDSILDRLYEAGPPDDKAYEEAPAPVPVTITDEMVERLARHYAENHGVPPDEPLYEGSEQQAWHAWVDDARAALTAALSAKPGEQG